MRRKPLLLLLGLAVTLLAGAALATAAPARAVHAYEWNTAVAGTHPPFSEMICTHIAGSQACFHEHGDTWWVEDTSQDGHSATASWRNVLFDASGNAVTYRQGSCVNKLGVGTWAVCNKDYYENDSTNALGGHGSEISLWACVYDSAAGTWHGCSGRVNLLNDE